MNNRWIVFGVIAAIGGLGFLLYERSKAASSSTPQQVEVTTPTDLSTAASEPGTGVNAGDYSAYNGYQAPIITSYTPTGGTGTTGSTTTETTTTPNTTGANSAPQQTFTGPSPIAPLTNNNPLPEQLFSNPTPAAQQVIQQATTQQQSVGSLLKAEGVW